MTHIHKDEHYYYKQNRFRRYHIQRSKVRSQWGIYKNVCFTETYRTQKMSKLYIRIVDGFHIEIVVHGREEESSQFPPGMLMYPPSMTYPQESRYPRTPYPIQLSQRSEFPFPQAPSLSQSTAVKRKCSSASCEGTEKHSRPSAGKPHDAGQTDQPNNIEKSDDAKLLGDSEQPNI